MATTETITRYKVKLSTLEDALGLDNIRTWGWDGNNLIAVQEEVDTPSVPIVGITEGVQTKTFIPWEDIRTQFLSGIPGITSVFMTFDSTYLYITVNPS